MPFKWVEYTQADAVLALTNFLHSEKHIRAALGEAVIIIPCCHSGLELAKFCHDIFSCHATQKISGLGLMHRGLFTFGDSARDSYERMIALVSRAKAYLKSRGAWNILLRFAGAVASFSGGLAALRRDISLVAGSPMILSVFSDLFSLSFAQLPDLHAPALRVPATRLHAIFTKRLPLLGFWRIRAAAADRLLGERSFNINVQI